jgi:hypothetical protein
MMKERRGIYIFGRYGECTGITCPWLSAMVKTFGTSVVSRNNMGMQAGCLAVADLCMASGRPAPQSRAHGDDKPCLCGSIIMAFCAKVCDHPIKRRPLKCEQFKGPKIEK